MELLTPNMYSHKTKPPKCRLHGASYSTCTMRVIMALLEKEIDYDLRIYDIGKKNLRILNREHTEVKYKKTLQPFGKIPAFQDCDVTMFGLTINFAKYFTEEYYFKGDDKLMLVYPESRAIIRHLARKHEGHGTPLYGSNEKERTLVDQWLEVESHNYEPAIAPALYHLVFAGWQGKLGHLPTIQTNLQKLEQVLDIYETRLSKSQYLAGDFFSLADLSHLPATHYLINHAGQWDLYEKRANVLRWWKAISRRPAWWKCLSLAYPEIYPYRHP